MKQISEVETTTSSRPEFGAPVVMEDSRVEGVGETRTAPRWGPLGPDDAILSHGKRGRKGRPAPAAGSGGAGSAGPGAAGEGLLPRPSRALLRDPVLPHLRVQGRPVEPQQGGRRLFVPAGGLERLDDG